MDPGSLQRIVATATALVLGTGIAVAATTSGGRPTSPGAPVADRPVPTTSTPASAPHHVARSPRHAASPAPSPTPRRRAAAAAAPLFPLPAGPAYPRPCPPPPIPPGPPFHPPKPAVNAHHLPAAVRVPAHRRVDLRPVTGKGMWLTTWRTSHVDVASVVARAKRAGLRQLWVRTGGTFQGWYGDRLLARLLPAAHAAGLAVIAWDFPTLSDPLRDVERARHDLLGRWGGQRLDGFSADLETIYEGTFDTPRRVRVYLSRVRLLAGSMPVVATVLRPTAYQLSTYPYRAEAPYVDVFAPMVYWSCTEPGAATREAIKPLARLRPVHVIGQAYDMGAEGGRHGLPSGREIWRFLDVAHRSGAVGASLYDASTARRPQWRSLGRYPWSHPTR